MSTRIGTMQPPRTGHMFWLPALLTLLAVVTLAVVAVSIDRDRGREDAGAGAAETTVVVNTPTELSGGLQEATATTSNTGRRGVTPRVSSELGAAANTPSELSGGLFFEPEVTATPGSTAAERYSRHQMI